jgi:hypothetical protein
MTEQRPEKLIADDVPGRTAPIEISKLGESPGCGMNADMVELHTTWYDDVQAGSNPMEKNQTRPQVILVAGVVVAARDPRADGAFVLMAGA